MKLRLWRISKGIAGNDFRKDSRTGVSKGSVGNEFRKIVFERKFEWISSRIGAKVSSEQFLDNLKSIFVE